MEVWKYVMKTGAERFEMPDGARILACQLQRGEVTLWALVNPELPAIVKRDFMLYGTEHEIPDADKLRYIDTVQNGPLVWHVFEEV